MSQNWNFATRPFQDDRPVLAGAAALLLIGAVLLFANLRLVGDYRRQVADTHEAIDALETRQKRADAKTGAAKTELSSYRLSSLAEESRNLARIVAERRFSWTTLLARLERTLPPEVGVARLQPRFDASGDAWLDVQLVARNRDAVIPTLKALARDPAFAEVELKTESAAEPGAADQFQFSLGCRYDPEGRR